MGKDSVLISRNVKNWHCPPHGCFLLPTPLVSTFLLKKTVAGCLCGVVLTLSSIIMGWSYPDNPVSFLMYAIMQLAVGFGAGYAGGHFKREGRPEVAVGILAGLAALQLADHAGIVPMPWNYHGAGRGPNWRQSADPYKNKGPPNQGDGIVGYFFKNALVAAGAAAGFVAGLKNLNLSNMSQLPKEFCVFCHLS